MKKRRDVKFCFVLSAEEKQKLAALADDQGRSAAGVIRHIIQRAWQVFPGKKSAS
jgi:predicted DNA-binding protein